MKILIFGASGMVGQGVLRQCLLDAKVQLVQVIGRSPIGVQHPKLRELVHKDLWHYASIEDSLSGFDACLFCLGASAALDMKREYYESINYGIPVAAAETLVRLNPLMTFIYVSSGYVSLVGTGNSEKGPRTWTWIRGRTEQTLLQLPFKAAYIFRPGFIEPLHGARSRTFWYRFFYTTLKPVTPLLRFLFPDSILTNEQIGKAMLTVSRHGAPKRVLESKDIRALASLQS